MFASKSLSAFIFLFAVSTCAAQSEPGSQAKDFVRLHAPLIAIEHVRLIDGTGAPAKPDQTIVISGGKIAAITDARSAQIPREAQRLDFTGYSALPGLVGMHDHLFYSVNYFGSDGVRAYSMPFSYPRLYLASGVTTIRTTGAFEPYTDLEIKKEIDASNPISVLTRPTLHRQTWTSTVSRSRPQFGLWCNARLPSLRPCQMWSRHAGCRNACAAPCLQTH